MTRAKYEFYAIVPAKSGASNNVAEVLFKEKSLISGVKLTYALNSAAKDSFITDVFPGGYKDIQKCLENTNKTTLDINDLRMKGSILHFALSKIVSLKDKDINESIDYAFRATKRKFFFEKVEFIKEKLKRVLSVKKISDLFMYDNIYNEKEIVNAAGETFRVDKLIIDNDSNEVVVADFKSYDYDEKKDKEQITNYKILLSEIYPDKKISAYIINTEKMEVLPICQARRSV
jgi:hypothetical protein